MMKFVKMMIVLSLVLLLSECHSAGMHKLPRRKSNSERDYGLLGNFIAAMADRWYATPRAPGDVGAGAQTATKVQDVASKATRKRAKASSKSRASASKASKQARTERSQRLLLPFAVDPKAVGQREYGLLGNFIASIIDNYNGVTPRPSPIPAAAVSASAVSSAVPLLGGAAPGSPAGQRDYGLLGNFIASLVDGPPSDSVPANAGNATNTEGAPSDEGASVADGPAFEEEDDEDIDLCDDEESDDSDEWNPSTSLSKLSPAERLKHLIEPFVLNLMVDDGGLRDAVEKLRAWESQERYENLNFIGGGIAAL